MNWESDISISNIYCFLCFLIVLAFKFFIFFIIENDRYLEREAELKELIEHNINIYKEENNQKEDEYNSSSYLFSIKTQLPIIDIMTFLLNLTSYVFTSNIKFNVIFNYSRIEI